MVRQTQSYLRSLFAQEGIVPRRNYGQNFLIDINIHELIVRTAELKVSDAVLEVGPGAGALTALMAESGAKICAVEIDKGLAELTAQATAGRSNVQILQTDILAGKNRICPVVIEWLRANVAEQSLGSLKLIANLPYGVAAPLVGNLLVQPEVCPELMVITVQQEVADRMCAEPGNAPYGAFSVLIQALADVDVIRTLPPNVFWPRPKVQSSIVRVALNPAKRGVVSDLPWFHFIVRRVFLHRRKNLRGILHSLWPEQLTKDQAGDLLEQVGLVAQVRAEALNVGEFIGLADVLKKRLVIPDESVD